LLGGMDGVELGVWTEVLIARRKTSVVRGWLVFGPLD